MVRNLFWNRHGGRVRALWRQIIQLLMFAAISFGLTLLVTLVFGGIFHYKPAPPETTGAYFLDFPMDEFVRALAIILSMVIVTRWLNRESLRQFGFTLNKCWWTDWGFGALLGLGLTTIVFLIELTSGWVTITGTFFSGVGDVPFGLAILSPLVLFLCAAVYEETLIRGYPMRNLAQGVQGRIFTARTALLLMWVATSIYFGWWHQANPHATLLGLINIGLAGLLFGLSYVFTGSLGLSLGLHFAWDFSQGCIFGSPVAGTTPARVASVLAVSHHGPALWAGGAFGSDAGFLVTLVLLFGMIPVLFYIRWRSGKLAIYTPLAIYAPQPAPHRYDKTDRRVVGGGDTGANPNEGSGGSQAGK